MARFCSNCGKELKEGVNFCDNCGNKVTGTPPPPPPPNYYQQVYVPQTDYIRKLSEKVKINAVIWIVIACLQFLLAIIYFVIGFQMRADGGFFFMMAMVILFVAIINTVLSVRNFEYSNEIVQKPVGIVERYRPIGGCVGVLIYNIFLGGLFGIIGAIHGFTVRSYVMSNEMQFIQIEQQFAAQNHNPTFQADNQLV